MPRTSRNDQFRNQTLAILYNLRNTLDYRTFNAYNRAIRNKRIDAVRRINTELNTTYIQNVVVTYEFQERRPREDRISLVFNNIWYRRTVRLTIQGIKKNLNRLAKQAFLDLKNITEQSSPIITRNWSYTVENPIAVQPVGLRNIPMSRDSPYLLSGEVSQEWNTNRGKCVIDYLVKLWGNTRGLKKIATQENLAKVFNEIAEDYRKINEPEIDVLKSGITIHYISNFCKKYNLTFYALNSNDDCIEKHVEPNSQYKCLMFRILNGHIYPIEDKKRKSILESIKQNSSFIDTDIESQKKKEETEKKDERIVIYPDYDETDGNRFILGQIQKYNKIPFPFNSQNISYSEGKFNYIVIDDKLILSEPIQQQLKSGEIVPTIQGMIKKYVEDNGEKYIGQSTITLLQKFWEETYGEKIQDNSLQSKFNPIVYKFLNTENVKYRTHYGSTKIVDKDNLVEWLENSDNQDRFKAVDLIKCYSSLLLNPLDNWLVYDVLDDIVPYVPIKKNQLFPFGLYIVETDDLTILHQSNIYSNKILDYARANGIKFTVKYQIIKTQKYKNEDLENRNYFHKIIEKITSWNMDKKMMKLIINSITGYMGRTVNKKYNVSLNTNILEVFENGAIQGLEKARELYFEKIDDLFVYGNVNETELLSNSLPIYIQILDWSNIKLHEMQKNIGGECLYRHTDMALMIETNKNKLTRNGADYSYDEEINDKDITASWGKTKEEDPRGLRYKHFETYMKTDRHCNFPSLDEWKSTPINTSNDYKKIVELAISNGGLLIEGRAGTGKDYVISQGLPDLESDCKLALTNKAALIMNGTTIHKALGINQDEKACSTMMKKYKNKKIIIVNEISMIDKKLWYKLYLLKKKNPNLIFILLGDFRQCIPIEEERTDITDFNYFNSSIVKFLSNYHKIELNERQRYDLNMWIMLEDFYEKGIIPDIPFAIPNPNAKKICYYNKTRKEVNRNCMRKMKPTNSLFLNFDDDKDDPSKYKQQPVYIYEGLPVMSIKNNQEYDIINGNEFIVKEYNETKIILDNNLEVPIDKFHTNFVVNYCSTTHKLQGATIDEKLYMYDFDKLMSDRHLGYTAMSRVKTISQLFRVY